MGTLAELRGFERLFRSGVLEGNKLAYKALQYAYLKEQLNRNFLRIQPSYKATYNRIMRQHFTNQQKINMLRAVENSNLSANNVKRLLKHVDSNLLNRNAAYNNAYNRVLNKYGVNRFRTRVQQGGTCWFHAIVNGLLMSARPRRYLKQMTANVPSVNFETEVCPSKNASREWFLKYIKHRLQGPGTVHNVFRNANVIKSVGLRGFGRPGTARYSLFVFANKLTGSKGHGGTVGDLYWFYDKMFPRGDFIIKKFGGFTSAFGKTNPEVPHSFVKNGEEYELTHSWINFWVRPVGGHAIAGYKTSRGDFVAYDSAFDKKVPDYDWTRAARVSGPSVMWGEIGESTGGTTVYAIYMRKGI
jgi:hypothetical protein